MLHLGLAAENSSRNGLVQTSITSNYYEVIIMIDISKVYTSNNYGDFKVVNYINNITVDIEFLSTGYKVTTQACQITTGQVKDKLAPVVFGVGFIGDGKHCTSSGGVANYAYSVWHHMIARCYCEKRLKIRPTYKGCTVCDEWLDFQVFADWFELNYISGNALDKDTLVKGNKVYSPDTCLFITCKENTIAASAMTHKIRDPNGIILDIYNLAEFCRKNDLCQGSMSLVCRGLKTNYKGWSTV